MNAAGFILNDQSWDLTHNPQGELVQWEGFVESLKRDDRGRVSERRTRGWSVAKSEEAEASNGLVYRYLYHEDQADGRPGELKAVGVMKGSVDADTNGTPDNAVYWLSCNERDPDHPELVTKETVFDSPVTDLESVGHTTDYEYEFFDDGDFEELPARSVRSSESSFVGRRPRSLLTATPYGHLNCPFSIARETRRRAVGSVEGEDAVEDAAVAYWVNATYDALGQLLQKVEDTNTNGLRRPAAGVGDPLAFTTTNTYADLWGLVKSVFPNGRQLHVVHKATENDVLEQWVFKDVTTSGSGAGTTYRSLVPAEVTTTRGGRIESARTVAEYQRTLPLTARRYGIHNHDLSGHPEIRRPGPGHNRRAIRWGHPVVGDD